MADRVRSEVPERKARDRQAPTTSLPDGCARIAGASPAAALELQRMIGNRAATRVLSRWAAHPDKDKKGQFMTDGNAAEWNRFNPPLSK